MTEMEQKIMETIEREADLTPAGLANRLGVDLKTIRKHLSRLEREGRLRLVTWEKLLLMGK